MARALQDILTELHAVYDPQRDTYNKAIQSVDPAQQAEEQGLQAAKTDAFAQIDQSANRRGLFYGGMPIAEEQRYTGQNFLPSLANLRSKYTQQKFDLTQALNKVTSDEYTQASGIHQNELDLEEKQREFDRQLAAQEDAQRRAAAAASAGAGTAAPSFSLGSGSGQVLGNQAKAAPVSNDQRAYNSVQDLLKTGNSGLIRNTYNAIAKSASYGNTYDQAKLQLLNQLWLGQGGGKAAPTTISKGLGKF